MTTQLDGLETIFLPYAGEKNPARLLTGVEYLFYYFERPHLEGTQDEATCCKFTSHKPGLNAMKAGE